MNSNKIIVGYIKDQGLSEITEKQARQNNVLNLAFGSIVDGRVYIDFKNLRYLQLIRQYNPNIKIVLSIGGWAADGFSQAASNEINRKRFAASCVQVVTQYGFDGIDIDWEYPCHSESGIVSSPNDKYNSTYFMCTLREYLNCQGQRENKHYILSIATGADTYYTMGTQMNLVQKYVDYVEVLTYDMRGGFQVLTGHHTNLFNNLGDLFTPSVQCAINVFLNAGVPRNKILVGSAFYSRIWENVPNVNNGLFQNAPTNAGFGPNYPELVQKYINKQGYIRFWDNQSKAPYLFNGSTFLTYDDPESITCKCNYVKSVNTLGMSYWLYDYDPEGTLLNTMYNALTEFKN